MAETMVGVAIGLSAIFGVYLLAVAAWVFCVLVSVAADLDERNGICPPQPADDFSGEPEDVCQDDDDDRDDDRDDDSTGGGPVAGSVPAGCATDGHASRDGMSRRNLSGRIPWPAGVPLRAGSCCVRD